MIKIHNLCLLSYVVVFSMQLCAIGSGSAASATSTPVRSINRNRTYALAGAGVAAVGGTALIVKKWWNIAKRDPARQAYREQQLEAKKQAFDGKVAEFKPEHEQAQKKVSSIVLDAHKIACIKEALIDNSFNAALKEKKRKHWSPLSATEIARIKDDSKNRTWSSIEAPKFYSKQSLDDLAKDAQSKRETAEMAEPLLAQSYDDKKAYYDAYLSYYDRTSVYSIHRPFSEFVSLITEKGCGLQPGWEKEEKTYLSLLNVARTKMDEVDNDIQKKHSCNSETMHYFYTGKITIDPTPVREAPKSLLRKISNFLSVNKQW